MTRGPRPHLDPPHCFESCVPSTTIARVNLALMNPVTGGRKKGALSALINGLLLEWLERQARTDA